MNRHTPSAKYLKSSLLNEKKARSFQLNKALKLFVLALTLMVVANFSFLKQKQRPIYSTNSEQSIHIGTHHTKSSQVHELTRLTGIDTEVMKKALTAFSKAKSENRVNKNILAIIDYSKPSSSKRLWVLDLNQKKVLHHTHVAHGQKSGLDIPNKFSNVNGSHQTSIGTFVTGSTYQGGNGLSLELHGLDKGFNDNALRRRIVIHPAKYVSEHQIKTKGRLGRSWGCPALSPKEAGPIIRDIKNGALLFSYYPDNHWLQKSRYL